MHRIYTIGYEALDVSRFLATLKAAGIEVLAYVRAAALSRKKGFSKTALRDQLEASGIGYEHFIQLGNPKQGRLAAREGNSFVRIYRRHLNSRITRRIEGTGKSRKAEFDLLNVFRAGPGHVPSNACSC